MKLTRRSLFGLFPALGLAPAVVDGLSPLQTPAVAPALSPSKPIEPWRCPWCNKTVNISEDIGLGNCPHCPYAENPGGLCRVFSTDGVLMWTSVLTAANGRLIERHVPTSLCPICGLHGEYAFAGMTAELSRERTREWHHESGLSAFPSELAVLSHGVPFSDLPSSSDVFVPLWPTSAPAERLRS